MLGRCVRPGHVVPLLLLAALAGCATGDGGRRGPALAAVASTAPSPQPDAFSDLAIEVVVTGRDGKAIERLRASDFDVTVDGVRRGDVVVARMYRGPGAAAAARSETAPGEMRTFAQPNRAVVIVVDQASLVPGEEPLAREAAETCLGLLGLTDRVWVVRLPLTAEAQEVSFERSAVRDSLSRLRAMPFGGGPASPSSAEQPAGNPAAGDAAPARQQAGQEDAAPEAHAPDPFVLSTVGAAADARRAAVRMHAQVTLDGVTVVLRSMEAAPGGKTMLLLSGGLVPSGAPAAMQSTIEAAAHAHVRIVSVQLPAASAAAGAGADGLRRLAEETGGSLVVLSGRSRQPLAHMAEQLSASYLLLMPAAPGAADASRLHPVRVQVPGRRNLTVRAASLAAPGLVPPGELSARLSPAREQGADDAPRERAVPSKLKRPASTFGVPAFRHQPELDGLLARVSEYVAAYGPLLSSIVSEERYVQDATQNGVRTRRTIVSDFLTVRMEGLEGWLPFRDVFEVDGTRVRDREDRIARLFIDKPTAERVNQRAREILIEGARFNIGALRRTLNVPTLPLWFLEAASVRRFAFKKAAEEDLDGTRVWVLDYTEVQFPTFIRTSQGEDRPSWGRIWVDPLTGTVHRTVLKAGVATVTVSYGKWTDLPGVWLPLEMTEDYTPGAQTINGKARYSKFRRFQVTTDQEIRVPKN
jgi:VWFA-related protein